MSDRCDRCGSVGEDRRTLWMACFYQMDELGLPFQQRAIRGHVLEKVGDEPSGLLAGAMFPVWGDPEGDSRDHPFFYLSVCKRCRGEWMSAIAAWFRAEPQGEDNDADEPEPGCGSGIFVRRNGATLEITRKEWDRLNPGREPVVYRNDYGRRRPPLR